MRKHFRPGYWLQRAALFLPLVLALVGTLGQSGCANLSEWVHNGFKVGPNYKRPPVPVSPQWIDAADPKVRVGDPNLAAWWEVFDDPLLSKLVHDAFANNLTIRAAGFQILQARELRCIALGELMPQTQSFILGYSRNMQSRNGGTPSVPTATGGFGLAPSPGLSPVAAPSTPIAGVVDPGPGTTTTPTGVASATSPTGSTVGVGRYFTNIATNLNASWELDFWGLFRRNLESANAVLDQSIDNCDELVVLLLANVATTYVEIRTLQRRLELARANVAFQEPLVAVYRQRWKTGIANAQPGYLQLLANLENTRALIPQLEITLRQFNNALCVLLGQPVRDLLPFLGDGTVPVPGEDNKREVFIPRPRDYDVVVAIPGDFLLRRPDVRSAEDQLRVQSAQIGIAEAEMYPHIGFNGTIGLASNHINTFIQGKSWAGNIGPSLSWNILNYGRLLANVRAQNYQFQQFVATYQQAILNANQDAENALVAYLRSIDQAAHLKASADSAAGATAYLRRQLREGYLPSTAGADTGAFVNQLFTLINFQVTQQDLAAQAEGNIALDLILLYRAMGGGWQIRCKDGKGNYGEPPPDGLGTLPPGTPPVMPPAAPEELPAPRKVSDSPRTPRLPKESPPRDLPVLPTAEWRSGGETAEPPRAVDAPAAPTAAGVWYTAADGSKIYLIPPPAGGTGK
jgi:NodT family efflux transporter outer membrane factor (OMF) lipoprotein